MERHTATADATIPMMLLSYMKKGEDVTLNYHISEKLRGNIDEIQDKYCAMYPDLKKVKVTTLKNYTACFFTGGVDSFYTVLKNMDKIDRLVYVQGFDIRLDNEEQLRMVTNRLQEATAGLGVHFRPVRSTMRDVIVDGPNWLTQFGAALASVALSLPGCKKMYIPSSGIGQWGSSPDIDPLWSTETTEIVHYGAYTSRLDKVRFISDFPVVLKHLRVCWESTTAYNCGYCEKCLRTLVQLYICGALDKAESFDTPTVAALANRIDNLKKPEGYGLIFAKENYDACPDGIVKDALRDLIHKNN